MGSFDSYAKGQSPVLEVFRKNIAEYNRAVARRARAAPWHLQLLASLGFPRRYDLWQATTPLHSFYEKEPTYAEYGDPPWGIVPPPPTESRGSKQR